MSCDITLMSLSYVWNCDPGTHMRCIRFSTENRVWQRTRNSASMVRTQGILDWFRPPESNTLRPVWWDYVESRLPPRRESTTWWSYPWGAPQAALYWLACLGLQVGFHLSYSVTIRKAYPSWTILSCTPSCLHVFGPTSQVGQGPRIGRRVFW
jgi:hypothetical protein